jgi:outer membrane protein OmpA-like peptidoglycan-associated protein
LDNVSSLVSDSTSKAITALTSLTSGFRPADLFDILNKSIINFPTGSAEVPQLSRTLLQQAAARFKQLPAGTVVEIGGYTDNTGDAAANLQLSQHRADAVKNTLVQSGVNADMLVAKGYGSANPRAMTRPKVASRTAVSSTRSRSEPPRSCGAERSSPRHRRDTAGCL